MMGYGDKKKIPKKQSKPKKNQILEGIKKDLNEWNDETFKTLPKRWSGASDKGLTEFCIKSKVFFPLYAGSPMKSLPNIKSMPSEGEAANCALTHLIAGLFLLIEVTSSHSSMSCPVPSFHI